MAFTSEMETMAGLLIFYLIYILFIAAFGIVCYVLRSVGMYTIAKRRGIRYAWFGWLPVVNQYLLGCISDQFQYVVKGKNKSRRKVLLTLNIVLGVIYVVFFALYIAALAGLVRGAIAGVDEQQMLMAFLNPILGAMAMSIPMIGVAIAAAVFRYMAMYDLYTSCSPQNNVLFLVLSIFFSVTEPFFVFFLRKKDGGMPPRKVQPQHTPAEYRRAEEISDSPEPWNQPNLE